MIADLKQDSLRWQAERDQTDARYGGSSMRDSDMRRKPDRVLGDYTQSNTHRSRQYYGFSGQGLQTPQMPPGVPVSQAIPAQMSYGPGDYTYAQTSGPYQQSTTAYAYPSPSATDYEPSLGQSREPRSQIYSYGQPQPGGSQNRSLVGTDPEAQANYYFTAQGQPMAPVGRGQTYIPAQPSYSQPPPRDSYAARDSHSAREEPGRRRRDR